MSSNPGSDVTRLLREWANGDEQALPRLIDAVYPELRRIAYAHLRRERSDHTLQPTALVHEAYLRLAQGAGREWQGREHFFAVAAHVVRAVLVDHARARASIKRGSAPLRVTLSDASARTPETPVDFLDLDTALSALERLDPQQGRIVELRHFAGLSIEETAHVLGVSPSTVKRGWLIAKTFIRQHMTGDRETP